MAIIIPGCETVPFTVEEQEAAAKAEQEYVLFCERVMGLPPGTLKIEFAKAVATDAEQAGYHVKFTDGAPFYAMEVRAGENSTISQDRLRLYLTQMAFNDTGRVLHTPPVLFRNFRGDVEAKAWQMFMRMTMLP
jgi:hypothetical protein